MRTDPKCFSTIIRYMSGRVEELGRDRVAKNEALAAANVSSTTLGIPIGRARSLWLNTNNEPRVGLAKELSDHN